jgi:hypothetical protein
VLIVTTQSDAFQKKVFSAKKWPIRSACLRTRIEMALMLLDIAANLPKIDLEFARDADNNFRGPLDFDKIAERHPKYGDGYALDQHSRIHTATGYQGQYTLRLTPCIILSAKRFQHKST